MNSTHPRSLFFAVVAFCAAVGSLGSKAAAAVNFFTDSGAWQALLGSVGQTSSEDFSGFAGDAPFHTSPVALAGMTISREGPEAGLSNYVDVPPLVFPGGSGTAQAELFTNTNEGMNIGTQVRITFDAPNIAFGFSSWEAVGLEGALLEVYDGGTLLGSQALGGANDAFLGYRLTGGDTATSVRFRSNLLIVGTSGEGFAIDDLAGESIPEPGTGALILVAAGASRRRQSGETR